MKKVIITLCIFPLLLCSCTLKRESSSEDTKEEKIESHTATLYLAKGIEFLKENESDKAILLFLKSIELNPDNQTAYELAAMALIQNKHYSQVISVLSPTITIFPTNGKFPFLMATAYMRIDRKQEALQAAKHSYMIYEAWQNKEELIKVKSLIAHLSNEL